MNKGRGRETDYSKYKESDAALTALVSELRGTEMTPPERLAKEQEVWDRVRPRVAGMLARFGLRNHPQREDIEAEAMVGVFEAVKTYDRKRGPYSALITTVIKHKIINWQRRAAVQAKSMPSLRLDYDSPHEDITLADVIPDPKAERHGRRVEAADDLRRALGDLEEIGLSEFEREMMFLFVVTGGRYDRIVETYNATRPKKDHITTKAVDNGLVRLRNKAKGLKKENGQATQ